LNSIKKSEVTDFDEFVAYIEEEINSTSDEQIYNFKVFLKNYIIEYERMPLQLTLTAGAFFYISFTLLLSRK